MTPLLGGKKPRTSNLTSTVQPQKRTEQRVLDVSSLGISVIEPPEETVVVPKTFSEADMTTMMESMGSIMSEKLGSMMGNMGERLSSMMSEQVERQMEKMAEMMASKVTVTSSKTPTRSSARTPARSSSAITPARTSTRTPGRRAASRATSSPKSLEAYSNLASRRETVCSPREMHEDNSLTERPTTIEVMDQLQEEEEEEEEEEDIISGNTMNMAPSLTPRHKRLQQVASASPVLSRSKSSPGIPLIPIYSSPASSSSKPAVSPSSAVPIVSSYSSACSVETGLLDQC